MTPLLNYLILCFGTLFAVLSPMATVPPFLAMTEANTHADRLHMAGRACSIAFTVLVIFAFSGVAILDFFGISVPAFKIAGGIVLLRASLEMLKGSRAKITTAEREEGEHKDDISITPLAVPLLCGPVTIASCVLLSARAETFLHYLVLVSAILVVYLVTYVMLRLAVTYAHLFGEVTMRVVTRLMGLLLAALAVQFVINGVRETDFRMQQSVASDLFGSSEATSPGDGLDGPWEENGGWE